MRQLLLLGALACAGLAGCQGYDFTVNDKVVYRAPTAFVDFNVGDPALAACIEQTIADQDITQVEQLVALNCSHAGIASLAGIEVFKGLAALRLSANQIVDVQPLARLPALLELYLADNQVENAGPLLQLEKLRHLDLSGNTSLACPAAAGKGGVAVLLLPDHCL
ncbi:MAG: hypothetical protein HKN19_00340 [Halioglobus sp.]|nr:hypothetical protein [Halioglobus sp.]